jgi:pyruvate dehydrogenase E2 component (dihydrolipoamide acetyltransferase)
MPISVVMPALEMAQDTGKLVAWRKRDGEKVTKGEILLEVETDKAVVEVEALADGLLAGVKAAPGDVIPVGQTIAWILASGESVPTDESPSPSVASAAQQSAVMSADASKSRREAPTATNRVRISPKARRLAQERGIDIALLRGSGPDGEILVSDVLAESSATPSNAAPSQSSKPATSAKANPATQALSSIARLMAERTTQSWVTVPHFFVARDVDASELNSVRDKLLRSQGDSQTRISHTDLLISVVARALEKHPRLNASWTGQSIQHHREINIGVAMAVQDGVVTGVVRNANKLQVAEIARQRSELADRARSGRLKPGDISDATFTISNLGMYRVDSFTAIIVPPQAAILAVGAIAGRVVAVEGKPAVRPIISMTLSCDHRVVDGARAAEFMETLVTIAQSPA